MSPNVSREETLPAPPEAPRPASSSVLSSPPNQGPDLPSSLPPHPPTSQYSSNELLSGQIERHPPSVELEDWSSVGDEDGSKPEAPKLQPVAACASCPAAAVQGSARHLQRDGDAVRVGVIAPVPQMSYKDALLLERCSAHPGESGLPKKPHLLKFKGEARAVQRSGKLEGVGDKLQRRIDTSGVCPNQFDILSSTQKNHAQSERSLAFKRWAQGRCYRCLAYDHQVRSCRNSFRCIRCQCSGHRERFCHLQSPTLLPIVGSNKKQQQPYLESNHHQAQPTRSHQETRSGTDIAYPNSMVESLLKSLRSELEQLIKAHLEELMHPIREELHIVKQWLARVATKLDCHEQDKGNVSTSIIPELFGPYSPVRRLLSPSTILDSLAGTCTSVAPLGCNDKSDSVVKPKAPAVDDELTIDSSVPEIPQKKPVEEPFEVHTNAENFAVAEDASDVEFTRVEHPIGNSPTNVADPLVNNSSSSDVAATIRDENFIISSSPTTTAKCRRRSCVKSSLRRSARSTPHNMLKELGFIRKNGKLDKGRLDVFADVLKELLPPELLVSLMKLEGHVFWEVLAKILDPLY